MGWPRTSFNDQPTERLTRSQVVPIYQGNRTASEHYHVIEADSAPLACSHHPRPVKGRRRRCRGTRAQRAPLTGRGRPQEARTGHLGDDRAKRGSSPRGPTCLPTERSEGGAKRSTGTDDRGIAAVPCATHGDAASERSEHQGIVGEAPAFIPP